jgi:hypothetical protein
LKPQAPIAHVHGTTSQNKDLNFHIHLMACK